MKINFYTSILIFLLPVLLLISGISTSLAKQQIATLVIKNANIYTVDAAFSKSAAIAVNGQYLVYVGNNAGVEPCIGKDTEVLDLGGRTILPGIIEGHMHLPMLGEILLNIDCYWKPKQAILDAVAARIREVPPGEWIQGFGWNNEVWKNKNYPTKAELDQIAPENPVVLTRTDGHMI